MKRKNKDKIAGKGYMKAIAHGGKQDEQENGGIGLKSRSLIKTLSIIVLLFLVQPIFSQTLTQKIKGRVFDNESQSPIQAASIVILNTQPPLGAITDENGNFVIEHVPLGRYNIQVSSIGYDPAVVPEILIIAGKETILETGLKQQVNQLEEVSIKAYTKKELPLNTMATISARSFSVEETRRYAGGLDDPARMVSAFSGVTVGNLQDNAIVIRGNSPKSLSWRLEGVEIPNPNHFAGGNVAGGGLVTIFSSQLLANSDFFTGAFPAEYGNALAGVFDMKFRTGNVDKREHTIQVGMMGIDLSSEGPFVKGKKATYLFNYRYSTTGLLSAIGCIPSDQIPKYQDLSFKLNFPTKKAGIFSIWGIGGLDINTEPEELDSLKWESDWDRIKYTWKINTGAAGFSHKYVFGQKTYINSTIAASGIQNVFDQKRLDDELLLQPNAYFQDKSGKLIFNTMINHKFSARHTLRIGFTQSQLFYHLDLNGTIDDQPETYQNYVTEKGNTGFTELYIQSKFDFSEKLTMNAGLHGSYFSLNGNYSVDPRFGLIWRMNPNHSLSFGYGKHSQLEELRMYMIQSEDNGQVSYPNKNLEFSQAHHFVLGYEWMINQNLRLKIEPYYQYLYNVPGVPNTSWSVINFKQDWNFRDKLENNSYGKNTGVDITFERFLNNNYYYLITASLFNSVYQGDDGIWHDTRFNKEYAINILYGREFFLSKDRVLGINGRLNFMGGERFNPVIMDQSLIEKKIISDDRKNFEAQLPGTYYLDFTVSYRSNKNKRSSVWALQIKNVLGSPMYDGYYYNYKSQKIENSETVVILPILSYKLEF